MDVTDAVAPFRYKNKKKNALCIQLDGDRWWEEVFVVQLRFLFLAFAYTNMQNEFYDIPNPPFADSKIGAF